MKKIKSLFILTCMLCLILAGCGKQSMNGYTKMNNIAGIEYYIPADICNNATAITAISPDSNYDASSSYSYKDENGLLLFKMSEIVIAVQKGTTFKPSTCSNKADINKSIESNSLLGIWFHVPDKAKSNSENVQNGKKYTTVVNAEVVINTNLYDNFTGNLSIIETAGAEYAIFAGYKGEDYEQLDKEKQEKLSAIASAFIRTQATSSESVTTQTSEPTEVPVEETPTPTQEPTPVPTEEPMEEDGDIIIIDVPSGTDEPTTGDGEDIIIIDVPSTTDEPVETPVPTEQPTEAPVEETPAPTQDPTPVPTEEPVVEEPTATPAPTDTPKPSIVLDNQKENAENSIYGMQELNTESKINLLQGYHAISVTVKPTQLYKDNDAINIIKMHCDRQDTLYTYTDAPAGCSWEAVKYTVTYEENDNIIPYINVKLVGLDGDVLRYRGVKYSKRTHDILISEKNNNGTVTKEYYVFYPVPNGCEEYALEIGDGTIHNDEESAYYLIKR